MTQVAITPRWSRDRLRSSIQSHPKRRLILVADDDRAMRLLVGSVLRSVGYDVEECAGGEALLERMGSALMNRREIIEAVITDVRMPGFTGLQVLEGMERAHRTTPVVLMTAFTAELGEIRARKHARTEVLVKPFDVDDLLTAVVRVTLAAGARRAGVGRAA